jgi:hypothetical protein
LEVEMDDTLSRLVRLETAVELKFEELEKALILARELAKNDRETATNVLNHRLEGMNEFQKRMDKLEGTFATKTELRGVERLVYVGVGIVLAVQFVILLFADRLFK